VEVSGAQHLLKTLLGCQPSSVLVRRYAPLRSRLLLQVAGRVDAMRTISCGAGRGGTACRGAVRHTSLSRRSRSRLTVSEERRERGVELATLSLPSSMSVAGALRRRGEGSGGTVLSGAWRLGALPRRARSFAVGDRLMRRPPGRPASSEPGWPGEMHNLPGSVFVCCAEASGALCAAALEPGAPPRRCM